FAREEKYFQPMDQPAPSFALSDADGHPVGLAELSGKIVVLNFIYTFCPDICPLESERIASVQRMVNPTPLRDRVRFVSITIDPVRDLPAVMKDYGARHGLDPANWSFLTSGADHPAEAIKLSHLYNNRFQKEADGSFMHGVVFHVIDGAGQWRGNFHGLDWKPDHLVTFLGDLANPGGNAGNPSLWRRLRNLL
ncbi:MAG TPA: SCO family protein, partial [Acetobacteraceae bacterium]|nr:SCO family protein [Acetobacteraceae bacterium]